MSYHIRTPFTGTADMMRHHPLLLVLAVGAIWLLHFPAAADAPLDYRFLSTNDVSDRYYLEAAKAPILIDGKADDAFWQEASALDGSTNEAGKQGPTSLRLGYDKDYLYLLAVCTADAPGDLVSKSAPGERDGRIWGGHCIDFKIGIPGRQFQVLVAPNGAFADMKNGSAGWNPEVEVKTAVTATGYVVELRLRRSDLGLGGVPEGYGFRLAFGRAAPNNQLQALGGPYGDLAKAPTMVLGTREEAEQLRSGQILGLKNLVMWNVDREEYPSAIKTATGRIQIANQGGRPTGEAALQIAVTDGERDLLAERIYPLESSALEYDLELSTLPPGVYTIELRLLDGDELFDRQQRRLVIADEAIPTSGTIQLEVPASPAALSAWPLTFGVPFPPGALANAGDLILRDSAGRELPLQTNVTSRWSRKGPIRWVLLDTVVPTSTEPQVLQLSYGSATAPPQPERVAVESTTLPDGRSALQIISDRLTATIPLSLTPGVANVIVDGREYFGAAEDTGPYLVDEAGTLYRGNLDPEPTITVEDDGPLKACVRVSGWHVAENGERLGKFILTYRVYAGVPHLFMDHTFIVTADTDQVRYRDIGYSVGTQAKHGIFGAPRLVPFSLNTPEDSAYLLQRDDLSGKVVVNNRFYEEFGKAEGWVSAGHTAVSMRDFWQNFPKEFGVTPTRLTTHFWPAHGEAPRRSGDNLSVRNAALCWFAHEGELLDFRVPPEVVELVRQESPKGDNWENAKIINAMGIAKTHHLMFQFHTGNWDQARVRSAHLVFDQQPTAIPDPAWVCASGVLGTVARKDTSRHETIEHTIDTTAERFMRQQEMDRDYGMWNFGDAHHNWQWQEQRWWLYRTWRATHHSWPRWPWLQALRSGSFKALGYARRNAYHVADISHCHYTDETFAKKNWPQGKLVGGICDYKGLAHWSAGNRLGYNSIADVLLLHYYVTGDLRARDTALAHGRALLEDGNAQSGREGSGRLTSLVALYAYTWDNDYLKLLDAHVDELLRTTTEETVFEDASSANRALLSIWTQGVLSYVDFAGAEKGKAFITRWADYLTRTGDEAMFGHMDTIESPIGAIQAHLAYAWRITGNTDYLGAAVFRNNFYATAFYEGDDPRFQGSPISRRRNMPWSFWLTDVGTYLAALDDYGKEPPEWTPPPRPTIPSLWMQEIEGKQHNVFFARIKQSREGAFQIHTVVSARGHIAELVPLDGGPIQRVDARPHATHSNMETIHMDVAADDCLEYALRLRSDRGYAPIPLPLATGQEGLQEVYPTYAAGRPVYVRSGWPFAFDLPAGTTEFTLNYDGQHGHRMIVRKGDGTTVYDESTISITGPTYPTLPIQGSPKGWSLEYFGEGGSGRCMVWFRDFGPSSMWLAASPERFFWPSNPDFNWE